ncbi:hypothetical protein SLE2022_039640 [Rubroshorea leprosula]
MDCRTSAAATAGAFVSPYDQLFHALSLIPLSHYFLAAFLMFLTFLYNFLEIHFLHDLLTGFKGDPVALTYNSFSDLYQLVAAKCQLLHGRYCPTPWISSPHLQTAFLSFFGRAPQVTYRRHLFCTPDGGTIALDWLLHSDVVDGASQMTDAALKDDRIPVLIVIPGLTSDSASSYVKHLVFRMARRGWNVVVSNHRGLGGVSITSGCFYNGGWTEDIRKVVEHIHCQHPEAPIFAVGTSLGANILVKYLGEDGANVPLVGAAAVCSPWDLLICDRFLNRKLVQKVYDRILTVGLQGYAQLHQSIMSCFVDWEGLQKSNSVREFDNHSTRILAKCETVDTYYRRASSVPYVQNVSVPLLCISALDDPVATREAIPWDECRANKNIILATTTHGGHLGFYEGLTAASVWWVRAVDEFFSVLLSCPVMNRRNKEQSSSTLPVMESLIDQEPFMTVKEDGMVTTAGNEPRDTAQEDMDTEHIVQHGKDEDTVFDEGTRHGSEHKTSLENDLMQQPEQSTEDLIVPIGRRIDQLARQNRQSIWLLAYIAIATTWPLLGPALLVLKRRFKNRGLARFFRQ